MTSGDFTTLATNFNIANASLNWQQGDLISITRSTPCFNAIATNFGAVQVPASVPGYLGAIVPEPNSLGAAIGFSLVAARRRNPERAA